jgi:hypothetical protein
MLKRISINQRWLPVPVPLKTLEEVLTWLTDNFIPQGKQLTSVVIDGDDITDSLQDHRFVSRLLIDQSTVFEVKVESPFELALQGLETAHNLCQAVLRAIKVVAVNLWQSPPNETHPELIQLQEDVECVVEIIDHARGLGIESYVDLAMILDFQNHLKKILLTLSAAESKADWKGCAQILLRDTSTSTGLETSLKQLQENLENAHLRLLTSRSGAAVSSGR